MFKAPRLFEEPSHNSGGGLGFRDLSDHCQEILVVVAMLRE